MDIPSHSESNDDEFVDESILLTPRPEDIRISRRFDPVEDRADFEAFMMTTFESPPQYVDERKLWYLEDDPTTVIVATSEREAFTLAREFHEESPGRPKLYPPGELVVIEFDTYIERPIIDTDAIRHPLCICSQTQLDLKYCDCPAQSSIALCAAEWITGGLPQLFKYHKNDRGNYDGVPRVFDLRYRPSYEEDVEPRLHGPSFIPNDGSPPPDSWTVEPDEASQKPFLESPETVYEPGRLYPRHDE